MYEILFFIVGACAVAYLLLAWRTTNVMKHTYMVLQRLGYQKDNGLLWGHDFAEVHPQMMRDIVTLYDRNKLLAELLCCPVCFSFHLALWTSLILTLLLGLPWPFIVYGAITFPIIALKLSKNA